MTVADLDAAARVPRYTLKGHILWIPPTDERYPPDERTFGYVAIVKGESSFFAEIETSSQFRWNVRIRDDQQLNHHGMPIVTFRFLLLEVPADVRKQLRKQLRVKLILPMQGSNARVIGVLNE